jgi:hypothetical protein
MAVYAGYGMNSRAWKKAKIFFPAKEFINILTGALWLGYSKYGSNPDMLVLYEQTTSIKSMCTASVCWIHMQVVWHQGKVWWPS